MERQSTYSILQQPAEQPGSIDVYQTDMSCFHKCAPVPCFIDVTLYRDRHRYMHQECRIAMLPDFHTKESLSFFLKRLHARKCLEQSYTDTKPNELFQTRIEKSEAVAATLGHVRNGSSIGTIV